MKELLEQILNGIKELKADFNELKEGQKKLSISIENIESALKQTQRATLDVLEIVNRMEHKVENHSEITILSRKYIEHEAKLEKLKN